MKKPFAFFCFSLASLLTAAVSGQDSGLNVNASDTLIIEYRADNQNGLDDDDNFASFVNRFDMSSTSGGLTASLRFDSVYFIDLPTDDSGEALENANGPLFVQETRLERFSAAYRLGDWQLNGGDTYVQMGRGILLSIRNLPELEQNRSVLGGKVMFQNSDHDWSLFGGEINVTNRDGVNLHHVNDPHDMLVGSSYEYSGFDNLSLGIMGMYLEPDQRLLEDERDLTTGGGLYFNMPVLTDWLSIYLEGDVQYRILAGQPEQGYAGYLTTDLMFGDLNLLVEGLWLDHFEVKGSDNSALNSRMIYNQAPTMERIDQEVFNNTNVAGGRVRAEYYIYPLDLLFYVNGLYRLNDPGEDTQLDVLHLYSGFEHHFQEGRSKISGNGGWRNEMQSGETVKETLHAEVDYLQSMGEGIRLHFKSSNEFRSVQEVDGADGGMNDYSRGTLFTGIETSAFGGLTFEFGYDTQNTSDDAQNYFYAGHLYWDMTDDITLRAIGGTQRGGIKCVNGVCRDYPEFSGGKLEISTRF
jgi:hypothetical protein